MKVDGEYEQSTSREKELVALLVGFEGVCCEERGGEV